MRPHCLVCLTIAPLGRRIVPLLLLLALLPLLTSCRYLPGGRRILAGQEVRDAQALLDEGMTADALAAFERAIELSPRLAQAHLGAAEIYRVQGDYEAAAESYGEAALSQPSNFDAHFGQGLMLQLLERFGEAVRSYLRAVQLRPTSAPANLNLATAYLQIGDAAQAVPYAEQAVDLDPGNGAAHMNLGTIYSRVERYDEALYEFEAALSIMGPRPDLLRNLAETQGKVRLFEEMRQTLVELVKIEPDAVSFERLGYAAFKARRYSAALTAFENALEYDADYVAALNGVGVCLLNRYLLAEGEAKIVADLDRAISLLRRSVQLKNDQPQIIELLRRYGR
jgi:tetratricopeptide (TPR) repeat protein